MQLGIKTTFSALLAILAISALQRTAHAQPASAPMKQPRAELALEYNFVRSNAPPETCACFNANGGSMSLALPIKQSHFALAADASIAHAGGISSNNYDLTLSTFTAGIRYRPRLGHASLQPFGQVLAGLAHASGSLVEGETLAASNAGASFAANVGGGLDMRLNRIFSLRVVEADYLLTRFDNGGNNRQNNLRLGAGIVLHF